MVPDAIFAMVFTCDSSAPASMFGVLPCERSNDTVTFKALDADRRSSGKILAMFWQEEGPGLEQQHFAAAAPYLMRAIDAIHAGSDDGGIEFRHGVLKICDPHSRRRFVPGVADEAAQAVAKERGALNAYPGEWVGLE
jgi:hypothetical protein